MILHYITLYYIVLYYNVLYHIILYYIILNYVRRSPSSRGKDFGSRGVRSAQSARHRTRTTQIRVAEDD